MSTTHHHEARYLIRVVYSSFSPESHGLYLQPDGTAVVKEIAQEYTFDQVKELLAKDYRECHKHGVKTELEVILAPIVAVTERERKVTRLNRELEAARKQRESCQAQIESIAKERHIAATQVNSIRRQLTLLGE